MSPLDTYAAATIAYAAATQAAHRAQRAGSRKLPELRAAERAAWAARVEAQTAYLASI